MTIGDVYLLGGLAIAAGLAVAWTFDAVAEIMSRRAERRARADERRRLGLRG